MSQAGLNRIWSQAILDTLAKAEVKHICIAPGSRSTPLSLEALELSQRSDITIHTHFDERGLGFLALGLAKATQQPVAVIVTSGTAVANLLPSVAESGLTSEKLLLLTADRPADLVGVGANQAIVQAGIYSSHVRKSIELPSPNCNQPGALTHCLVEIQQGLAYQSLVGGALHINCPFPEPLYIQSLDEKNGYQVERENALKALPDLSSSAQAYPSYHVAELTNEKQQALVSQLPSLKGVIVIGKMPLFEARQVKRWAEQLGWPILADPQSGVTSDWAHFDLWLQHDDYAKVLSQAECILQFGARLVSKRLGQWLRPQVSQRACSYWLFDSNVSVLNPDHLPQLRTVASISASITLLDCAIGATRIQTCGWADELKSATSLVQRVTHEIQSASQLTECQLALALPELLDLLPAAELFIGNSLIVRLLDMLTPLPNINVHTNRGASGIDGLIATSAGVQRGKQASMLTLIGDTSLLYDLNSLSLLSKVAHPHVVVVTNNDGGAIFDLLPVPELQKQCLYQMPHGYQFEHAAKQFGLHYIHPQSWSSCLDGIQHYLDGFAKGEINTALVVEVITPPEQASQQIQSITQAIKSHAI